MGNLVDLPHKEITATLEFLTAEGLSQERWGQIRRDGEFRRLLVQFMNAGCPPDPKVIGGELISFIRLPIWVNWAMDWYMQVRLGAPQTRADTDIFKVGHNYRPECWQRANNVPQQARIDLITFNRAWRTDDAWMWCERIGKQLAPPQLLWAAGEQYPELFQSAGRQEMDIFCLKTCSLGRNSILYPVLGYRGGRERFAALRSPEAAKLSPSSYFAVMAPIDHQD